ncbi:hypothetical protein DHEL01_v210032 [Diaporthe helianthi]|uniref:Ecp2 effector protein domain-containing protein n=1 Tax=Diaporthe helianthi TaxID=158607 RepID=A0A2P5HMV9_DIAHE|nr:hypothetical protein DHEL01_v210032 [Diaporthe helianthi]
MTNPKFLAFPSVISCFALASPVSPAASIAHPLDPTKRVDVAPVRATDDVRLCSAVTGTGYEYGEQTNQSRVSFDCKQLANNTKALGDKQGNFSEPCNAAATEFVLFAGYGDCTMWFECPSTTDAITNFGYGDVADVLNLATNALQYSSNSNTSIMSSSALMSCQSHQMNWLVAFNGSKWAPGMGPAEKASLKRQLGMS